MGGQQQLRIGDRGPAGFLQGSKPVDQMACGDQHSLFGEKILDLWPIDNKPLVGGNDDILLQAEIGRA